MRRLRDSDAARRRLMPHLAHFAARLDSPDWPTPAEHDTAEQVLADRPGDAQAQLPLQGAAQNA